MSQTSLLYLLWQLYVGFPTVIFLTVIFCCCKMPIYIYLLFSRNDRLRALVSFCQKFISFFSYTKLNFCESKSIGVHKVRGSFRCTRSEPTGCRILGEERNQNFLPVQWGRFLSKDSVYALQPRLYLSSLNFFFLCLLYVIMHYLCVVN